MKKKLKKFCYCFSKKSYAACCEGFIKGKRVPKTPEQLMRSRYTAFCLADAQYVKDTMKGEALLGFDEKDFLDWSAQVQWKSLKILRTFVRKDHLSGIVEFVATYSINDKMQIIHEISDFQYEDGRWFYIKGTHL